MHTNVKGLKYKTEKIKTHAKENRYGYFRSGETKKSTAGSSRRMKEKTGEIRRQNEMLKREMQKSTNA